MQKFLKINKEYIPTLWLFCVQDMWRVIYNMKSIVIALLVAVALAGLDSVSFHLA